MTCLALMQSPLPKEFFTRTLAATDKPKGIYKQEHFTVSTKIHGFEYIHTSEEYTEVIRNLLSQLESYMLASHVNQGVLAEPMQTQADQSCSKS